MVLVMGWLQKPLQLLSLFIVFRFFGGRTGRQKETDE